MNLKATASALGAGAAPRCLTGAPQDIGAREA